MQTAHCARMRSKTGYAEFRYFHCYLKMDAPRALVFRPLVKGNEALGTRLQELLARPDFLSLCRVFISYSQPIRFPRFDGKSVNHGLPVLDQGRALDPCRRSEGSWALGTRQGQGVGDGLGGRGGGTVLFDLNY